MTGDYIADEVAAILNEEGMEIAMTVRAKFQCIGVTKRKGWGGAEFVYDAEFQAVTNSSGTDENKSFFAATPAGSIKLSTVRDDLFQVGEYYYVDFAAAPA